MNAREIYLRDVYPRLMPPLTERYPLVSIKPQPGRKPLGGHALLMVVALTGTGKSTALDILSRRLGGRGFGIIPTRREVADWIAIPLAQHWSGDALAPAPDRVKRFAYTRRFAERVEGGMAAAFSWLNLADDHAGTLLSEGIRGDNEISYALSHFPSWRIVELALHPLTRLRRLSGRKEAFDRATGKVDLSFLPPELREATAAMLRAGEISEQALAITRAEAANYGLYPFAGGQAYPNYHRLDIDGCRSGPGRGRAHRDSAAAQAKERGRIMPVISRIGASPYPIPLKSALTWGSSHELRQLEHALIRVELSDGAVGFAEATPRPSIYGETQASILHIIDEHLAPMLLGETIDSFATASALAARAAIIKNNNTARGALDMALHQALANSRGESLATYLGATRQRIRLSAIVSTGAPEAVAADVQALYQAGIRVFKVKIGRDIPSEILTIAGLIQSYPDAQFYVDANETLESDSAAIILGRLRQMGVLHCEEALPAHLLHERRQLRRDCALPIIADDSAFTTQDLEREIAFDTFDILNIKTARTGFSESTRMLKRCRAASKM